MQVLHVVGLEGYRSIKHGIKDDTGAPQVSFETLVTPISDDFRCDIGRRAALLSHDFIRADLLTHTEICDLDHTLAIEEDVIQLYISVQDILAVKVTKTLDELLEEIFGREFIQLLSLSYIVQEVTSSTELHN